MEVVKDLPILDTYCFQNIQTMLDEKPIAGCSNAISHQQWLRVIMKCSCQSRLTKKKNDLGLERTHDALPVVAAIVFGNSNTGV